MSLSAPVDRPSSPALSWLSAALVGIAGALALSRWVAVNPNAPDAPHYLALAAGEAVQRPFAFRVLAPHMARWIATAAHRPLDRGFYALGLLSMATLIGCLALPLLQSRRGSVLGRSALLAGLLLTPVLPRLWSDLFLPDLLHAALTAAYFLLLRARLWWMAAALLPVLFLARESTILLALVAALVLARMVGRRAGFIQAGGAFVGWLLSQRAGAGGLANQRALGSGLYLLGKVPHNLLKNVLGTTLWMERIDGLRPAYLWHLPSGLHLGSIHQIGLISIGSDFSYFTLLIGLTTFGIGAALALLLFENRRDLWGMARAQPWIVAAAVYGLLSFLLAPALGPSVDRLFAYGWPLFLMAMPVLLLRIIVRPVPVAVGALLLLLQAGLGMTLSLMPYARPTWPFIIRYPHILPLIAAVVCLSFAADLLRPYTHAFAGRTLANSSSGRSD